VNIIIHREKVKPLPLVKNETKVFILPTLIQYNTGIPSQSNKIGERHKRDSNREGINQIIPI
jgi:hypothetical protein